MQRVAHIRSASDSLSRRHIGTVVTGYIAIALLVITAALPATARAAVYIGGSPPATVVVHTGYYFKPWVSAPANTKVTFSIQNKPGWAHFNTSNGVLSGGVYPDEIGSYKNIWIIATGGGSSSHIGPFAIAVVASGTTTPTPPTTPPPPATTAGTLELSAPSYTVAQTAGALTVSVNRTAGSSGAVSASYATANNSAVAGTDYTAVSGTLTWSSGDTAAKTFSVPVLNTVPFTGSKSFTVAISQPSAGATVGTPASAPVAIAGSAAPTTTGTGGPAAVTNLQLINQGGPNDGANPAAPLTNVQQISWSAAAAGAKPVSYYKIYRNGTAYATTTALTYTDTNATASNDPLWATPAKIYSYNVSAVDSAGNEGPQAAQMAVYAYRNGVSNWGDYDLSWGTVTRNYTSTAGSPLGGTYDISILFVQGGFQPTVHPPQAPMNDLEIGAFNYFTVDINPGSVANYNWISFGAVSRLPPGDIFGWHANVNVFAYGPAPVANKWATYKVPLTAVGIGTCQVKASISGNQLTVTSIVSGEPLVDAGGFVTGPGVPAGTYIVAYAQNGAIGNFTVAGPGISGSTQVASTTMNYQRTSLYKFAMFPDVGNTTIYFNNMGFSTN